MDIIVPQNLLNIIMISSTLSAIIMIIIQKFKAFNIVTNKGQIFIANLILSLLIGMPFAVSFYGIKWQDSIWVSLFSFIGADAVYQLLKNQKVVNYTPKTLDDYNQSIKETEE